MSSLSYSLPKFKITVFSLLFLPWIFSTIFHAHYCHAFSNTSSNSKIPTETNGGAWKTRPLVPELAKTPVSTKDKVNVKDPSSDFRINKNKKREKWDFFRFLSQSSKFVTLPKPPLMPQKTIKVLPGDVLWQTATATKKEQGSVSSSSSLSSIAAPKFTFAPLDDVVMGGVSSSSFSPLDGTWKGTVSDSNSGGFVGIRSTPFSNAFDMSKCKGVELTLRGSRDKIFKAVIRDSTDFNGICWTTTFGADYNRKNRKKSIAGGSSNRSRDWMGTIAKQANVGQGLVGKKQEEGIYKVKIPFDELIPTIFARTVPGQKLNPSTIQGFQIAYSKFLFDGDLNPKFELGDFQLDLLKIQAY